MAQQTINVGASPNDGTGTPLRTAFQYTNSNFSELYTAVGPSGNNIVVPGSATITGDLTVDTNTLKVDSANNVVGIQNATPEAHALVNSALVIGNGTAARGIMFYGTSSSQQNVAFSDTASTQQGLLQYDHSVDQMKFFTSGTLQATLNSTGLGVGVSPAAGDGSGAFKAAGTGSLTANSRVGLDVRELVSGNQAGIILGAMTTENTAVIGSRTASGNIAFQTFNGASWGERMRIDYLGNVGIGVTPSAWGVYKGLQVGYASLAGYAGSDTLLGSNVYFDGGAFRYIAAGLASSYRQLAGGHQWSTAVAGANPGDPLTLLPQMTLDASGNLLVAGTSAYIRAGGRTQIVGGSVVDINTVGNNVGIAFGGASSILPCDGSSTTTDGVANFGSASKRWNTIYASTGTINTSDQNEKQDIADLGDAEKRVAGKIKSLVKKYRFKDAVASKGENARIHVGWIAQDIQNAFSSEGLDASKYGVFCSDTWEENGVQKTRLGLRYDEVLAFVVSVI